MNEVKTIKVKHKDGYMLINESDFDKNKDELYKEEDTAQKKEQELDPVAQVKKRVKNDNLSIDQIKRKDLKQSRKNENHKQ